MKRLRTQRAIGTIREYLRHRQIILVDMTQIEFGIPKVTIDVKRGTLAYPHNVRVHVKTKDDNGEFEVDVGGFTITQTISRGRW